MVSIGIDGVSDHLTCLLRNLYVDQEATVRTGHGTVRGNTVGGHLASALKDNKNLGLMRLTPLPPTNPLL